MQAYSLNAQPKPCPHPVLITVQDSLVNATDSSAVTGEHGLTDAQSSHSTVHSTEQAERFFREAVQLIKRCAYPCAEQTIWQYMQNGSEVLMHD